MGFVNPKIYNLSFYSTNHHLHIQEAIFMDEANKDELVRQVANDELALHHIDKFAEDANDEVEIRRRGIAKKSKTNLVHIVSKDTDYNAIRGKNAENVIGMTRIPLGLVGPIRINGGDFVGETHVPMATTEGALIASASRGIKAINLSGGATTRVIADGMSRGPMFEFNSVIDAYRFVKEWLPKNFDKITEIAEGTTNHGKLKHIKPKIQGNNLFLRFVYSTGDAMGMNMATIATEAACTYIENNFEGINLIAVSGNFCSDKKQSLTNALEGRGKSVVAEAVITQNVLKNVFKTTAQAVDKVNQKKNWIGSATAGSATQFNAHFANIIAAIFLATGQDAAQVVESSSGYTITEVRGNDLYISATFPSLEVGTVGGGTALPTQKEALSIMGVHGSGNPPGSNSRKFAEIIAATVLAGELNLIAALATRELGKAHSKLGRNKKQ